MGASPDVALADIAKSQDLYTQEPVNLAPFDMDKVRVAKGVLRPKPAAQLLPGEAAETFMNFKDWTLKAEAELEADRARQAFVRPVWDPKLRVSRRERRRLSRQRGAAGVGGHGHSLRRGEGQLPREDIQVHEVMERLSGWPHLGAKFDGGKKILMHRRDRVWRVYLARKALLRRRRLSGEVCTCSPWRGRASRRLWRATSSSPQRLGSGLASAAERDPSGVRGPVPKPGEARGVDRPDRVLLRLVGLRVQLVTTVAAQEARSEMRFRERWCFPRARVGDRAVLAQYHELCRSADTRPTGRTARRSKATGVRARAAGGRSWRSRSRSPRGRRRRDTRRLGSLKRWRSRRRSPCRRSRRF